MTLRIRFGLFVLANIPLVAAYILQAQQKGQYVPGQWGLNAGVIPAPGFTYANMPLNYSASKLNDSNGNHLPNVSGTYGFWVDENIIIFVPKARIFGGYFAPYISINPASGSLVADLAGTNLGAAAVDQVSAMPGSSHSTWAGTLNALTSNAGYAFVAPTGRFVPGARTT